MLSKAKNWLNNQVAQQSQLSLHSPMLGLGRSVLALSLLLTLLCTDARILFSSGLNPVSSESLYPLEKINFFRLFGPDSIVWAKWLAIAALLAIISGVLPQLTCIVHWYLAYSFVNAAVDIEGGDQICANMTLLLIPICLLDNRFNHWRPRKTQAAPWRQLANLFCNNWFWLLRLQVLVIYLHSASGKFVVNEWLNGTALYYWFNHPMFGMQPWLEPIVNPLVQNPYTAFVLTWGVMIFELYLAAAVLINKKYYKTLFKAAVGFHFLIVLFHGLFSFFISMSGALVLYFLVPWDVHRSQPQQAVATAA
jgi:antimicrobial peptide system SdpB family protein